LTGLLTAAEWSAAATMTIPLGTLLAQNDANNLYIGLDITSETGAPNTNDYFQFIVDINGNGVIDARRDKSFGIIPGQLNTLTMVYMLAPGEETGVPPGQVIPSKLQSGFGASLNSATPHRQWQIAFALSDLGISPIDPAGPSPIVDFGLMIGTVGGVEDQLPADADANFSDLNQIVLACTPAPPVPGGVGPVIATVGLVGTGDIAADGYCTITAPYYLNPDHAAFCGTLNFIGNVATLTYLFGAGAVKYQVNHRYGATPALAAAAPWTPILQSWANFEIEGVNDVWQSFGPDASGYYPFINPSIPYTIQNLLFQWTTSGEPDGSHQFQINFFNSTNGAVALPSPVTPQVLTLELDNQPPNVELVNILFAGAVVSPCAIVNLTAADPGVQLQFEAYDPEGDLLSMALTAEWGHGNVTAPPIYSDSYSAHASPTHIWQGVLTDTQPAAVTGWVPPQTCAYLFQIEATTRTTNGYSYPIVYATDFQTVTLIKPTVIIRPPVPPIHLPVRPVGLQDLPESGRLAGTKNKK
jgi:hypothetical protein